MKGFRGIGTFVLLLSLGLGITTYVVTRPPERGANAEEAAWIREYVGWWRRWSGMLDAAYVGSRPSTPMVNDRVFEPLRACGDSLARVGPAPKSVAPVEQSAQVACGEMQYSLDLNDQFGVSSIASTKQHLRGAAVALDLSAGRIDNILVIGKHLKTRSGATSRSHVARDLSEAATNATGQAVTVTCWSDGDWPEVRRELALLDGRHRGIASIQGAAGVWLKTVHLAPATCSALEPLLEDEPEPTTGASSLVPALAVLAHEAAHAAGIDAEVAAECDAIQYVRPLVGGLGAASAEAAALANDAWRLYRTRALRPSLWSPECRDGGPLDLGPKQVWP